MVLWCSIFSNLCFCALFRPSTMMLSDFIGGNPKCSKSVHVFPSPRSTASNASSILSSWPTLDFAWSCAESISPSALVVFDAWRGSQRRIRNIKTSMHLNSTKDESTKDNSTSKENNKNRQFMRKQIAT